MINLTSKTKCYGPENEPNIQNRKVFKRDHFVSQFDCVEIFFVHTFNKKYQKK